MPFKFLPLKPSLEQLKKQAKALLKDFQANNVLAITRFQQFHPQYVNVKDSEISLSDAQWIIAREHGYESCSKIKHHVENLQAVEQEVANLRNAFATSDLEAKEQLIEGHHSPNRFENLSPHADTLSDHDARVLLANKRGYAHWVKYHNYLHLDANVRAVIEAIHDHNLQRLERLLAKDSKAANPHYVPGYEPLDPEFRNYINDSIPLFKVSNCVFDGQIPVGTDEYAMVRVLIEAGTDTEINHGYPMTAAVSYNAINVVRALLDHGATVDGPYSHGCPMAFAMHFGFDDVAKFLAQRGAKVDFRFAAGLGNLETVESFINPDGSLAPDAGILADAYTRSQGPDDESRYRMERSRENILLQAFYFACRNGNFDVAQFLLNQGIDINAIVPGLDCDVTTLHWCSWIGAQ